MFALCSNITIGAFKNVKPHEVRINKSIYEYVDKAVIKVPITSRIKRAGEVITESAETAKLFGEGDAVTIQLGYNGVLREEFRGFISRVNFTTPLEIECEGYSYQLRKRTYTRTFVNAELLDVLNFLVEGTDIILDTAHIPSFRLQKIMLQGHSGTEVLEMIKHNSHDTVRCYFRGNLLYVGLLYQDIVNRTNTLPDVKYRLGWNVIKDGNLKLRQAKNQEVDVHFVGVKDDGTTLVGRKQGDVAKRPQGRSATTGETRYFKSYGITDQATLTKMAVEKHSILSYDGYEGKITAFLQPYCEAGYRGLLEDVKYPERSGTYLVESTEVTYGNNGARRIVGIGIKLQ